MPRLVFHRGTSFVSKAIQFRDRLAHDDPWANHVSIELIPGVKLIEAQFKGVERARTLRDIVGDLGSAADAMRAEQVRVFQLPTAKSIAYEREAAEWLIAQVGTKYDFTGIAGFVLPLHGIRGRSNSWFCSELAKAYCDKRGVAVLGQLCHERKPGQLGVFVKPETVDPSDLMDSAVIWEVPLDRALET